MSSLFRGVCGLLCPSSLLDGQHIVLLHLDFPWRWLSLQWFPSKAGVGFHISSTIFLLKSCVHALWQAMLIFSSPSCFQHDLPCPQIHIRPPLAFERSVGPPKCPSVLSLNTASARCSSLSHPVIHSPNACYSWG